MSYQATLLYTEPLLRQAVFGFWRRTVGIGFAVALGVVAASLAALLWQGASSWVVGVLATVLVFAAAFVASLYVVHYRNALHKLRQMGSPQATLVVEESSFTVTSGIGSVTLRWSSFREVWCFSGYWWLLFSKAQFVTLPLSCLSTEMQAFILRRVQASGGKIEA